MHQDNVQICGTRRLWNRKGVGTDLGNCCYFVETKQRSVASAQNVKFLLRKAL
jgi:hypothetical protein